jgi:RNA polymerase sigma-70 factor (ECF subfamily)
VAAVADTEQQVNQPLKGGRVTGNIDETAKSRTFEAFFRERFRGLTKWLIIAEKVSFADAEEAVTEAMAEAYSNWPSIAHPDAWVRVAARRRLVRAKDRGRQELPKTIQGGHLPLDRPDDDIVVRGDEERFVLEVLHQLPPKQREVLAYSCDSYEPAEIAEEIGANPATVRRNLHEARAKAAKLVEELLDEAGQREIRRRREA